MADNSSALTSKVGQIQTNTAAKVTASSTKATTSAVKESDVKQKAGGSSLADFLLHLDDYTPTVCLRLSIGIFHLVYFIQRIVYNCIKHL
jgi:hypothetical protein